MASRNDSAQTFIFSLCFGEHASAESLPLLRGFLLVRLQGALTLSSRNGLFAEDSSPKDALQCACYPEYLRCLALSPGENVCERTRTWVALA